MDKQTSAFLDCARWVAAFFVVFHHTAHLLTRSRAFLTELGHPAVVVFFVVSGYLVGGSTLAKWKSRGVDLVGYSVARFSRIYIVLVPTLLFGLTLDSIGLSRFDIYSHLGALHIGSLNDIVPRISVRAFIGNALMLQGTASDVLGSNGPLWSLAYEWWYYCLFAMIAGGLFLEGGRRYLAWACAVPLLAILAVLNPKLLIWGLLWLVGVAAYFVRIRVPPLLAALAFLVSLIVWQALPYGSIGQELARDSIVALGFCAILLSNVRVPFPKLHERMAGFSYSLYLVHFPAMLFLTASLRLEVGASHWGAVAVLIVCLYAVAYAFFLVTERNTNTLRSLLSRYVSKLRVDNSGRIAEPETA
jgi:peptidoglycan/LPS O-acetylase OafA/YrhL